MILIIGYGSIGSRHARVLKALGQDCAVVSKHQTGKNFFQSEEEAFKQYGDFEYVVVSNQTSKHYGALQSLKELDYKGTVLVEKPLFEKVIEVESYPFDIYVAYNLRFHPFLQDLKELFSKEDPLAFYCYVGQYLPSFRPSRDYTKIYSARKSEGGGVLRDLSHELDYTSWLCGSFQKIQAQGGKLSNLEIDTEDTVSILAEASKGPRVSVSMNYLDRISQRHITAIFQDKTVKADFVNGLYTVNEKTEKRSYDSDYTYREMHKALLSGKNEDLCTFFEAFETLRVIETVEAKTLAEEDLSCV